MSSRFNESHSVCATVDPVVLATTETAYTDSIDMRNRHRVTFVLLTGDGSATSSVAIAVQANDASATDSTTWATTGISAYAKSGVADNEQVVVEIEANAVPSTKRYIRALLTAAADATGIPVAVVALGDKERVEPASHLASTTEISA